MVTLVFGGPSLEGIDLSGRTSLIFPPAAQGDLLRRVREIRPIAIGLLDGDLPYRSFPVWHKEILFALNRGIAVVGAAGVGAHRAVELAPHGMEGVGSIHRRVASGALERDDEVLCDWESAPGGIKRLSLPLVSMRDALAAAREGGLLSERSAATLIGLAEELFWRRRTWETLLERARRAGVAEEELARGGFKSIIIKRTPYAAEIGSVSTEFELNQMIEKLRKKNWVAYTLPFRHESGRKRVMVGAFRQKENITKLIDRLIEDGFDPKIIIR